MGSLFLNPEHILSHEPSNEFVLPRCIMGIEVEAENLKDISNYVRYGLKEDQHHPLLTNTRAKNALSPIIFGKGYWYAKYDGSLRNDGVEFVTDKLYGKDLSLALDELNDYFMTLSCNPTESDRCSVHIHLDIRDLSKTEFIRLLIDYAIFENVLFNYCGKHRKDNLYCLPFARSDMFKKTLADMYTSFEERTKFTHIIRAFPKYSALNVGASAYYCSLEFRQYGGTTDMMRIKEWINIIMCLKKNCKGNSADNLHRDISRYGYGNYLERVFGKYSKVLDYNDCEADIIEGVRLAQDILNHNRMVKSSLDYFLNISPFNTESITECAEQYVTPEPLLSYTKRVNKNASKAGLSGVLSTFLFRDISNNDFLEEEFNEEPDYDEEGDYDEEEEY